jgi:Helix-turn-helix.
MSVFERIKELADKRKISLQKVAVDLGFGENYIYNLKGAKSPAADKLALIADYFDVSVDYLLGREESTFEKMTNIRKKSDDELKETAIKNVNNLANLEFDALNYEALSAIVKITDFATYYKESENSEQNDMFYWQMLKSLHALLGSFSKPLYYDSVERIEYKYFPATKALVEKTKVFLEPSDISSISELISKETRSKLSAIGELPKRPKKYVSPLERIKQDDNDD